MTISRIAKLFAAANISQAVNILTQLLLPPTFLHVFGTGLYGQWITLSASISYLSTLNYGLQTYTNMQMTIHYNRGEIQACRELQSAGLRILLSAFVASAALLLFVFFVPLQSWLHLTIPQRSAQLTLYFFGLQAMSTMVFGFFAGSYMVFGEAHRGANTSSAYQLLSTLTTAGLVLFRAPFAFIAAIQVLVTLSFSAFLYFDLSKRAPDIKPTVQYWKTGSLSEILKPSAQYMLLASGNLLAFQVPVVLMQRILGPAAVVVYSVTRTIYSMSRRLLYLVTNSLGPEVTIIYGQQDWSRLYRLYDLSERVILLLVPPITFGSMLATPLLMKLWLHKANLYNPSVCILLGLTVSVLSIKEHKYQFQFSSNKIAAISYLTIVSYTVLSLIAVPAMLRFGLQGFLVTWLVCETLQLFYLLHLNDLLFGESAKLDHNPVYKLFGVLAVGTCALYWPIVHITQYDYLLQTIVALGCTVLTAVASYWIFRVDEVRNVLWEKLAIKLQSLSARYSKRRIY
jgi:O-antigen/teichoic acid export membrane protein